MKYTVFVLQLQGKIIFWKVRTCRNVAFLQRSCEWSRDRRDPISGWVCCWTGYHHTHIIHTNCQNLDFSPQAYIFFWRDSLVILHFFIRVLLMQLLIEINENKLFDRPNTFMPVQDVVLGDFLWEPQDQHYFHSNAPFTLEHELRIILPFSANGRSACGPQREH